MGEARRRKAFEAQNVDPDKNERDNDAAREKRARWVEWRKTQAELRAKNDLVRKRQKPKFQIPQPTNWQRLGPRPKPAAEDDFRIDEHDVITS